MTTALSTSPFLYRSLNIYLWRLFLLFSISWAAHGFYFVGPDYVSNAPVFAIPVILGLGLAFTRRRAAQIALFAGLLASEIWWMSGAAF